MAFTANLGYIYENAVAQNLCDWKIGFLRFLLDICFWCANFALGSFGRIPVGGSYTFILAAINFSNFGV